MSSILILVKRFKKKTYPKLLVFLILIVAVAVSLILLNKNSLPQLKQSPFTIPVARITDGNELAYIKYTKETGSRVHLLSSKGDQVLIVGDDAYADDQQKMSWSPDGKYLMWKDYAKNRDNLGMIIYDVDNEMIVSVLKLNQFDVDPNNWFRFSSDSKHILYGKIEYEQSELCSGPCDVGTIKEVTYQVDLLGKNVTFLSKKPSFYGIYSEDCNGKTRVSWPISSNFFAHISGRFVGDGGIQLYDPKSKTCRYIIGGSGNPVEVVDADINTSGKIVAIVVPNESANDNSTYPDFNESNIFLVENGKLVPLTSDTVKNEKFRKEFVQWSPDGKLILYTTPLVPYGNGRKNLYVMDADGKNRELLLENIIYYSWRPH